MFALVLFILLISLSALFSGAETAFFSLRDSQVRIMEKERTRNADLIRRLKDDPQRLLITLLIGNNVVNLSIASFATVLAVSYFGSLGAGIAAGISVIVVLFIGEIFPKTLAFTYRTKFVGWVAFPVYLFYLTCYPATSLFVALEKWLKKRWHADIPNTISEEEIRIMAELGLEHGAIDHHEREMIENIFDFDDTKVRDIMTPKKHFDLLNGEVPVDEIAHYVSRSGFSRFPVYEGNPNDIRGYVHTNDVMRVLNSDRRDEPLINFVSALTRVSGTTSTEEVFRRMTKDRSHMYLVHKHGSPDSIIGLVTMEDLLEEIVGEIEDEGDKRDRSGSVESISNELRTV